MKSYAHGDSREEVFDRDDTGSNLNGIVLDLFKNLKNATKKLYNYEFSKQEISVLLCLFFTQVLVLLSNISYLLYDTIHFTSLGIIFITTFFIIGGDILLFDRNKWKATIAWYTVILLPSTIACSIVTIIEHFLNNAGSSKFACILIAGFMMGTILLLNQVFRPKKLNKVQSMFAVFLPILEYFMKLGSVTMIIGLVLVFYP